LLFKHNKLYETFFTNTVYGALEAVYLHCNTLVHIVVLCGIEDFDLLRVVQYKYIYKNK